MASFVKEYLNVWKWLLFDWGSRWVLYGSDFNPTDQSDYSADHCTVYQPTSNFDLSWFQPWHEVWACAFEVSRNWWGAVSWTLWIDFMRSKDWSSWSNTWSMSWDDEWDNTSSYQWKWWWVYFWVDSDEIWSWYRYYKIHVYHLWYYDWESPQFTVSNLSIDSSTHRSWALWIDWRNICFVDWTEWSRWYKHRIAYDDWYSSNVWSENAWAMWLDGWDNLRIYYVDEYWTKRRTYMSDSRYWWNINVWSSRKWYMWVSNWWADDWYWHLCFIAPNWSKRRILNWPPAWYQ